MPIRGIQTRNPPRHFLWTEFFQLSGHDWIHFFMTEVSHTKVSVVHLLRSAIPRTFSRYSDTHQKNVVTWPGYTTKLTALQVSRSLYWCSRKNAHSHVEPLQQVGRDCIADFQSQQGLHKSGCGEKRGGTVEKITWKDWAVEWGEKFWHVKRDMNLWVLRGESRNSSVLCRNLFIKLTFKSSPTSGRWRCFIFIFANPLEMRRKCIRKAKCWTYFMCERGKERKRRTLLQATIEGSIGPV